MCGQKYASEELTSPAAKQVVQPYLSNLAITEIDYAVNNSRNNGLELLKPAPAKSL